MYSFVARLRARVNSQSTILSTSTRSDESIHDVPSSPTSTAAEATAGALVIDVPPSVVGRRIHPHVSQLMNSFSNEAERAPGLTPPPSAPRSPLEEHADISTTYAGPSDADLASLLVSGSQLPPRTSRRNRQGSSRLSRSLETFAPYSTFGRTKASSSSANARSPAASADTFAIPGRQDRPRSRRSGRGSTTSLPRYDHSRLPSARASSQALPLQRSKSSSNLDNDDERPSPSHTTSSRPHSTRTPQSGTSPSANSTRSQSDSARSVYTPVQQVFSLPASSPHTFGQPSPPEMYHNAGQNSMTPPPPLPPLVHPELVASLASRPKVYDISNIATAPRRRHSSFSMKTYPARRHKPHNSLMDENIVTLPSGGTFGRSLRNYASMPGVRQIFNTQRPPLSRSQSTARLLRRLSAEWNASQAISGVTEDSVGPNWPAEVSREILRLTLGASALGPDGKGLSAVAAIRRPREGNVVSLAADERPCSPPLTSHAAVKTNEDDSEGGGTRIGPGRESDNLASTAPGGLVEEGGALGSMFVQDGSSDTLKRDGQDLGQPATLPKATGVRAYRKSILLPSSSSAQGPEAGPSSLQMTMASSPTSTPTRQRNSTRRPSRISSEPTLMQVPETPTKKGKRKAEEIDITPPDQRTAPHTTFVIPPGQRRAQAQSEPGRPSSVHAPSAYQRKRVRLSDSSPAPSVKSSSRPGSTNYPADASSMASGSRGQHPPSPIPIPRSRTQSRAASTRSNRHSVVNTIASTAESKRDRRRTLSQVSIPVSAIVAPHPPSIGRSSMYHMRDPHRPVIQSTSWVPRLKSPNEEASPPHAWCFFIGFILFPLWWLASFLPVPRTRLVGGTDIEKGVTLDDPQVEHDARTWRKRCRIMFAVSLVTYVPFIILVAIFAPR